MNKSAPAHYQTIDPAYEAINVIEAWGVDFCLGNVLKYIARHGKKESALDDLRKAEWYLRRKIQQLEHDAKATYSTQNGGYFGETPELSTKRLSDHEAIY